MRALVCLLLPCLVPIAGLAAEPGAVPDPERNTPDTRCLRVAETPTTPTQVRIADMLTELDRSGPPAQQLVEAMARRGETVCLEADPMSARGYFDPQTRTVVLDANLAPEIQVIILAHEIRHADQVSRGYCPSVDISRQAAIHLSAAMEADAQAITTLTAWNLKGLGTAQYWDALVGMPNYADIARRFEDAMATQDDLGAALAGSFDQWYASEWRTEAYYASSCEEYLSALEDRALSETYVPLPPTFFDGFCALPDGEPYPCDVAERSLR